MAHRRATHGTGVQRTYGYDKYRSKLERARDTLPADEEQKLGWLGVEELEWLAVFLSVGDWNIGRVEEQPNDQGLLNNIHSFPYMNPVFFKLRSICRHNSLLPARVLLGASLLVRFDIICDRPDRQESSVLYARLMFSTHVP